KLQVAKINLEQHISYKTEGIRIRSRIKWLTEGERPTRYFFGLAKSRQKQQTIHGLYKDLDPNKPCTDSSEITEIARSFYEHLYTAEPINTDAWDEIFEGWNEKIPESDRAHLEVDVSEEELLQQLQRMYKNKTPGMDGLPSEWYKLFWDDIKDFLVMNRVGRSPSVSHLMRERIRIPSV